MLNKFFLFDNDSWMAILDKKNAINVLRTFKDLKGIYCFDSKGKEYTIEKEYTAFSFLSFLIPSLSKIHLKENTASRQEIFLYALRKFLKKFDENRNTEFSLEKLTSEALNCYILVNWNNKLYTR